MISFHCDIISKSILIMIFVFMKLKYQQNIMNKLQTNHEDHLDVI